MGHQPGRSVPYWIASRCEGKQEVDGCKYSNMQHQVSANVQDWVTACAGKCEFDFVPFHFYGTEVDQLIDYVKVSAIVVLYVNADLQGI